LLTLELEELINQKIASGLYDSPIEVIREGLRLLKEQDESERIRSEELRREVMKGYEQSERGESEPLNVAAIKAAGRRARIDTGDMGEEATAQELTQRGYLTQLMPRNNPGFDIACVSPSGNRFRVEVKTTKTKNADVYIQLSFLNSGLISDLFFVWVAVFTSDEAFREYYILTHEDVKAVWDLMPRIRPDGELYKPGFLKWKYIQPHHNR
jgi:antitoxin ParD1/3/4